MELRRAGQPPGPPVRPLPPSPLHPVPPAVLSHVERRIGLGNEVPISRLVSGQAATPNNALSGHARLRQSQWVVLSLILIRSAMR